MNLSILNNNKSFSFIFFFLDISGFQNFAAVLKGLLSLEDLKSVFEIVVSFQFSFLCF